MMVRDLLPFFLNENCFLHFCQVQYNVYYFKHKNQCHYSANLSVLRKVHFVSHYETLVSVSFVIYGSGHETAAVLLPGFAIN